jgi:outer membrane receptor protein involved in Fe transport
MKTAMAVTKWRMLPAWLLSLPLLVAALAGAQTRTEEKDGQSPNLNDREPARNASSAEEEPKVVLDKFVVTADEDVGYLSKNAIAETRTATNIMLIPQTIGIVNQEILKDLRVDTMVEAIAFVAGGTARRSFNSGDDRYMWGFRNGGSLKDGVPVLGFATGTLYDVDRIEVLSGPAALQFGAPAEIGGTVNYVTRQPGDRLKFEGEVTVGSYDYYRAAIHLNGPINDKLSYRLDLGATDSKVSERLTGHYEDRAVSGALVWRINDRNRLVLSAGMSKQDYTFPQTILKPNGELFESSTFTINPPYDRGVHHSLHGSVPRPDLCLVHRLGAVPHQHLCPGSAARSADGDSHVVPLSSVLPRDARRAGPLFHLGHWPGVAADQLWRVGGLPVLWPQ